MLSGAPSQAPPNFLEKRWPPLSPVSALARGGNIHEATIPIPSHQPAHSPTGRLFLPGLRPGNAQPVVPAGPRLNKKRTLSGDEGAHSRSVRTVAADVSSQRGADRYPGQVHGARRGLLVVSDFDGVCLCHVAAGKRIEGKSVEWIGRRESCKGDAPGPAECAPDETGRCES